MKLKLRDRQETPLTFSEIDDNILLQTISTLSVWADFTTRRGGVNVAKYSKIKKFYFNGDDFVIEHDPETSLVAVIYNDTEDDVFINSNEYFPFFVFPNNDSFAPYFNYMRNILLPNPNIIVCLIYSEDVMIQKYNPKVVMAEEDEAPLYKY